MRRLTCLLACTAILWGIGRPASGEPPTLLIPRVADAPILEQYLDGKAVPPGVKVTGLVQREPGDGVPASVDTDAYLSYDAAHLYVVFICRDDPRKVRANLTKREAIMGDDVVGLVLDTYHDGRRAYMFLANPLGIQMDGVTTEGQDDDYSYDALWQSEGRLTGFGYVVLYRIPFKSLRFSNVSAQTWGVAVGRIVPRNNETSFWPYITRRIAGFGSQMATMDGLEGISPGRNLQAIPYGTFSAARYVGDEGARLSDNTARGGVDAKAVIKDAVTVDVTVNPDFSQVESDEPQVTVNQRFEVYFPEKRPFFMENASYFETPQALFFSRRVADPGVGVRVTGKAGGWAFAGLAVNDEQPGRAVPDADPAHGRLAGIGVLRFQREFARQSYIGGIVTDREFGPSSNRVAGVDGRWKLTDNWVVTGQWVGSQTSGAPGAPGSGSLQYAGISYSGRRFNYNGSYTAISPDFRSDLGYIRRVDMRETEHEMSYFWFPAGGRVMRAGPELDVFAVWDYRGQLQDWSVEPGLEVELAGQTEIGFDFGVAFERFEGIEFRRRMAQVRASTEWLSWLNLNGNINVGTGVNYYPPAGMRPFLGSSRDAELGVTVKPSSRLRLDQAYLYSRLATRGDSDDAGCGCGLPAGRPVFTNHIVRTRVNYQFTRPFSARVILDYNTVRPNAALVDLERERRFHADVLFTYLVNPWTAIYLGYTDAYENRPLSGAMQRPVARSDLPLTSVGRQVFVKVSYLLRY